MDSTGSVIGGILESVRHLVREPSVAGSTFDNNRILRSMIMPAYVEVLSLLNMHSEKLIISRFDVALAANTEYYMLPPCISQVVRVVQYFSGDTAKIIDKDFIPRGNWNMDGEGWRINGNSIQFRPVPQAAETWTLLCVMSGDMQMHIGEGTIDPDADETSGSETTFELDSSPTTGILDKRPNAYVGSYLRITEAGSLWQERLITAHDAATNQVTVSIPFDVDSTLPSTSGNVTYEVCPAGINSLSKAVAAHAAMEMGIVLDASEKKMKMLELRRDQALKALLDNETNVIGRVGKQIETHLGS